MHVTAPVLQCRTQTQQKLEIKARVDRRLHFLVTWCAEMCRAALQDSCEAGDDSILDLVDYCHRKLTLLASKATREGATAPEPQKHEGNRPLPPMEVWLHHVDQSRCCGWDIRLVSSDNWRHSVSMCEGAGDTKSHDGVWNLPEGRVSAALRHRSHKEVQQRLSTVVGVIVALCHILSPLTATRCLIWS